MSGHSVVVADDHDLVAKGLAAVLAGHHEVVGIVHSGKELVELLQRSPAQGVLLDLSMPGQSGLEILPKLRDRWPHLKVIILTMHVDRTLADTALGLGAHGYVPKDACLEDLLTAIDAVFAGETYVSPLIPRHSSQRSMKAAHPSLATLTPRQEEILLMLADGQSSAAIADRLGVCESTVTFHRANLRRKLGISTELGLHEFAVLMRVSLSQRRSSRPTRNSRASARRSRT